MALGEFSLIKKYFSEIYCDDSLVNLGIGDDCALVSIPDNHQLAVTVDTLVADVHFPSDAPAAEIAKKALAVNLSDLASMGARPLGFTLALTLPEVNENWLAEFSRGLGESAQRYAVSLLGGDTTRGPLSISIQAQGILPDKQSLLRSSAQRDDLIVVTGYLGDAAAALNKLSEAVNSHAIDGNYFLSRYYRPEPRLALAEKLLGVANAAVDISDGLLADLNHICERSHCGAEINLDKLPLSAQLLAEYANEAAQRFALTGGDDYELCFTLPASQWKKAQQIAEDCNVNLTVIGRITDGGQCICKQADGSVLDIQQKGYEHFRDS